MREILVLTSPYARPPARTDCRSGGGEAGQPLEKGVFGQFCLAEWMRACARRSVVMGKGGGGKER